MSNSTGFKGVTTFTPQLDRGAASGIGEDIMGSTSCWFGALAVVALLGGTADGASAQSRAIGFKPGMNYSDARLAGQTLYVAGQAGAEGPDAQSKDITAQTTAALTAIGKIVKSAGYQMSDVVSVTVYMTDLSEFPQMNAVYRTFFPDPKPARATVQVAGLVGGARIEISAIAAK